MLPKVSILIPCYNAERWIAQAIDSALSQTYSQTEVIVVDDGSSDGSLEIIQSYGNQIRWETQPNQGGNITRNRLLKLSTGEWLQYLDADDYLLPDKIEQQIQHLSSDTDILYSPSIFEYWQDNQARQEILPIPEPHDPWILLARWYLPQTGSPLWRKQAIAKVGGWKIDQPCCQEHELYLRLLKANKQFTYCSSSGSVYRQWSESTVCKKNLNQTRQQQMWIEDEIERYLRDCGELTPERQQAIHQTRFESARMIWLSNPDWAEQVIAQIRRNSPQFMPSGQAAPNFYRWVYRWLGFGIAEQVASAKRRFI